MSKLYSGPAKLKFNGVGLFPEGMDGPVHMETVQDLDEVASGMTGRVADTTANTEVAVDLTPFDNWGLRATLFPAYITTPVIGTIIGAQNADAVANIWTPDGRIYPIESAIITGHPELHLGTGKALYGAMKLMGILASGGAIGAAASFYTLGTGAGDPGGAFTMADCIRERWTGAWGAVAGWGGDGAGALEAEDEFIIQNKITWKPLKVQKLTRAYQLVSVEFLCKFRPYGPTQAQIDAALLIQANGGALGRRIGQGNAADLVLTSSVSGKTITLKNCEPVSVGYDFGGNKLGNGEVMFKSGATFNAGVMQPLIVFSA